MVGAGVLGLPDAAKYLGWVGATIALVLSWVVSLYTLHQIADLHEVTAADGTVRRINRYHELGAYAFVDFGLTQWMIVFTAVHLFLIHVPSFNSLRWVSLVAAVMSMGYSTIAIVLSIMAGKQPGIEYNLDGLSTSAGIFGIFNALGIVAFAYGGLPEYPEGPDSVKCQ
ncbi:hypothetical protein WJX73_001053 [Symbiochloris irregularis]|uniref:Amino acid transporter transmembrane domain-containing protein n=1 Tax=Symbiochloris irregularis TaxID=706552 RepID=A0AAW1NPK1_9CHLO